MPSDSWSLDDSEQACLESDRNGLVDKLNIKEK